MARTGSDPFVEQVRSANDIVDIVGAQVALTRAGIRLKGLCPFHQEKTPSFHVSPDHQTYHCFGCGAGGDVFSFVMELENMTFPEALRHLAERAGIPVPDRQGPSSSNLERIRQALQIARGFFVERLRASEGTRAREYLAGRGIGQELIESYGLGFAPDSWDGLLRHAKQWITERSLIEAGLAIEGQGGRAYDRFRNRVIVPIESSGGAPVGFGGRILADEEPKYLNSPETPVYRKGSVLFGAAQARTAIREENRVLVVEGYFDVLALAQSGIGSAVGTCGTALTPEQARHLARYGGRIVLLFDGDKAGIRAALRALPIVVAEHADVRVLFPPSGQDPDDWVRSAGEDAVRHALDHAWTPVGFLEERVLAGALTRDDAARQAVTLVGRITDPLVRDLWVQEISGRFGVREDTVWTGVKAEMEGGGKPERAPAPRPSASAGKGWKSLERVCLQVALEHPDRATEIAEAVALGNPRAEFAQVLSWLSDQAPAEGELSPTPAELVSRAQSELEGVPSLASALVHEDNAPKPEVGPLIDALRTRALRHKMAQVTRDIRRAESVGDQEALSRLLMEKQRLARGEDGATLAGSAATTGPQEHRIPSTGLEAEAEGSI
ncbi:MAG: DNA primase [Candidatus Eisenbacteria bacterium]|uniref:DNA primase n=1 Tax=Eiseniibacteriota bacterium TaxID=2212470 RepID=A0A956NHA1_UNCEI|nr:DNA primase [Candidatus Eisenbacteria bacterium]MCB9462476.1 DNA primase [Candidatus Eisenbacteria bacterium]